MTAELIGGDDKEAIRLRIADVDDTKVAAGERLTNGHPRVVAALAVFARLAEYGFDFVFIDAMVPDVRFACLRIEKKP